MTTRQISLPASYRESRTPFQSMLPTGSASLWGDAWGLIIDPPETSGSSTLSYPVEQTLTWVRRYQLHIPNPQEVRTYLYHHIEALEILPVAAEHTRREFPLPAQLWLQISRDPEFPAENLNLIVRLADYAGVLDRIDAIRARLDAAHPDGCSSLLITTDFALI